MCLIALRLAEAIRVTTEAHSAVVSSSSGLAFVMKRAQQQQHFASRASYNMHNRVTGLCGMQVQHNKLETSLF